MNDKKRKPIAILQFVNKHDFKHIDSYDLDKIKAMKDLLGLSIENCSEHHAVINVKVGVQNNFHLLGNVVARQEALAEEQKEAMNSIPMHQVKTMTHELQKAQEKTAHD